MNKHIRLYKFEDVYEKGNRSKSLSWISKTKCENCKKEHLKKGVVREVSITNTTTTTVFCSMTCYRLNKLKE